MRSLPSRPILAVVLLTFAAPAGAAAQVPGIDLKLSPRVGLYIPASDLGEARSGLQQVRAEMEGSLAIGLSLELDLPASPINLRANMDYATGTEVSFDDGLQTQEGTEATLLALTGDLVFRPLPRLVVVQPYLLAGGGIKRYDFDLEDAQGGFGAIIAEDERDWTLHVGAGLDVGLGPLALFVEGSDYISWFELDDGDDTSEAEIQHDIFAMVGVRVGMF